MVIAAIGFGTLVAGTTATTIASKHEGRCSWLCTQSRYHDQRSIGTEILSCGKSKLQQPDGLEEPLGRCVGYREFFRGR